MKNFIVLVKPVQLNMQNSSQTLAADYVQLDYLFQEMMKLETGKWNDIKNNYAIDEKSICFQTINGRLCVAMFAFRK